MVTGNENVQFDLDDLLSDVIATQLAQEAKIKGLIFFLKLLAKRVLVDEPGMYREYIESFEMEMKNQLDKIMDENKVMQQILKNKAKEELGIIPGIQWS